MLKYDIVQILNIIANKLDDNIWNYIRDIFTIITPILIGILSYNYSKKLNKKILNDNKISRIANFQSCLHLKNIDIIVYNDSWHNYTAYEENQNVLLSKSGKIINGTTYAFEMNIYLKNLSNIFPNEVLISELLIWDNTINKDEQTKEKQLYLNLYSSINMYKPITIDCKKNIIVPILCCITNAEHEKMINYDSSGKKLNIQIKIKIKNVCGIYNDCIITGCLKETKIEDIGTKAIGGSKTLRNYFLERGYLKILKIYEEEMNNE